MEEQNRHGDVHEQASLGERFARARTMAARGFAYWKGAALVFAITLAAALGVAMHLKHVYRSECTILAKAPIRTDDRDDSGLSLAQIARQAARLKDMLTARARLESAIKKYGLYKETVENKTMLDAVEGMKPHVGFRSLEGGQYVISFDGDDPDTVRAVTAYLAASLIDDYTAGGLGDLRRQADFLAIEEDRSLRGLEDATRELTVFLAAHPEFAVEAKEAATPFGPSPAAGIPLMPKAPKEDESISDPALAALYRERARLDGEARGAGSAAPRAVAIGPAKELDDQIAQAQDQVEVAAKRVAETQADLASKSNLTEDHPDMRAARMAAGAAARFLHESQVELASLEQTKANGSPSAAGGAGMAGEIAVKLRQLDDQIAIRRSQDARVASGANAVQVADAAPPSAAAAIVDLETDWQRLLRGLNEAKSDHDDLKLRTERAKLAVEAARAESTAQMEVVEPPYRPTHPTKGRRAVVAIGGFAFAWLLAIAYAGARVALDDTLIDGDDLELLGPLTVLGTVPRLNRTPGSHDRLEVRANAAV